MNVNDSFFNRFGKQYHPALDWFMEKVFQPIFNT
ncbi:hypothetical protein CUM54_04030 [Enterococcus faecalis]|uniref:Uncharacterized protein n=2 Tax=Enterococcus faecalis TaxID=1351 RepID=Q830Z8_ENTFA|nr:hypothetical protein EF_2615 [Enterococcus faecalis V583]AMR95254.1 hypothetical protein A3777_06180 [Enterococcus faecalis]AUC58913.1 hypothetical protein CG806_11320 [Enterococcus faecalis ARO1/DG]AZV34731.1 hypothetical protein CVT43_10485 [Enterococcus faecalis OG1RF]EAC5373432.1 hypothetical protein [Listeria monocytogenes]EEI10751.1 hypothetical protein HMPREF0348_2683 [Enterococcus faecalis TX0104]EEI57708.1 hypothetical protein HMPREF0346_1273 [Enterococcus faecalis EnGen0297]EEN7